MIIIKDLTLRVGGRTLLEKVSLTLNAGHRYGLVGRNGTGKSTFFSTLLGDRSPDDGSVLFSSNLRVGHVAQELPEGSLTPLEIVLQADQERLDLLRALESGDDPSQMAEIYDRLHLMDAFSAESRAAQILSGLGFSQAQQNHPVAHLSGGWRMRVALARVLFFQPDWLFLDEPTNHLDLEASLWLSRYLSAYPKNIVMISHDRQLLNDVCDKTLFLHARTIQCFEGNYDTFANTWEARQVGLKAQHSRQERDRKHMMDFVNRFRAQATKARQAQSRLKALGRMETLPPLIPEACVRFQFPSPPGLPPPLVVLDQVSVGYDQGPTVLSQLSQRLDPGDRIGLLGANGNGKSTFAQLITGTLAPRSGTITRCPKLKIGYFSQHHTDALDVHTTASGLLMQDGQFTLTQARGHLGRFGLSGDLAETPIGHLSGGEKARLSLALLCRQAPHILILDEPTNHLDMDSRQALKQALNEFDGAIILITHDWDLLEATVDTLWLVADAKVTVFDGDLQDYRRVLLSSKAPSPKTAASKGASSNGSSLNDSSSSDAAHVTKSTSATQSPAQKIPPDPNLQETLKVRKKVLTQAQKTLDALEVHLRDVLKLLEDPKLYQGYSPELEGLVARKAGLEKEVKAAEDAWLEAVAGLEALEH